MGQNTHGQLGDGTTIDRNTSVQVEPTGVSAISAGSWHSLYVKTDNTLWAIGQNHVGQLGDSTTTDSNISMQIDSNVTTVSGGGGHTLYLKTNGALMAMGGNDYGHLADGSETAKSTPTIALLNDVREISAGYHHNFYLKTDDSLWAIGQNHVGQLGDSTTTDSNISMQILTGLQMQPKRVTVNATVGGSITGAGTYDLNGTANLVATPNTGYLFTGWVGDLVSSDANVTLAMSSHKEVNATFAQDTGDNDADGLTNYRELVQLTTNPDNNDTDSDGLLDGSEDQFGLNPKVADTALMTFITNREDLARSEGNASGIAYVQANLSSYDLYTELEKNASDSTNYSSGRIAGIIEGNASGIAYVQANLSSYDLYTELEKNASDSTNYSSGRTAGIIEGNASGIAYVQANPGMHNLFTSTEKAATETAAKATGVAEGLATVQADMATQGLSLVTYLDKISAKPHTYNWYYQPEWGWLWTNEENFPFVYKAGSAETAGTWLYFSQLPDQPAASFYDYSLKQWVTLGE